MAITKSIRILAVFGGVVLGVLLLSGKLQDGTHQDNLVLSTITDTPKSKITGVSFVAPPQRILQKEMEPILDINAGWVAVIPYAFSKAGEPEVNYDYPRQWWGERREGTIETIKYAKTLGLKVMVKPHIWVLGQGWAGDYELSSDQDWQRWEHSFETYILDYAKVADSMKVELFCMGTEYRKAVVQRPAFWTALIGKIRQRYHGKLTYAANWDNFHRVDFWEKLDYIGIDAYFPLSSSATPKTETLVHQWDSVKQVLKEFSEQRGKPVLFTEYGYRSMDHTADGHWMYNVQELSANPQGQHNAYEALYQVFWEEHWFLGGFLWKWHAKHNQVGGIKGKRYTPQNKPAAEVIKKWYGKK